MMRTVAAGLAIALGFAGSAFAQSRQEQSFGPWTLTTIVDQAGGPTRAILRHTQAQAPSQPGGAPGLTIRCRSDQPAKLDAIFSASQSLTSRATHAVSFDFGDGPALTQTWSSKDEYGGGLNGSAYNYVQADVAALLSRMVRSQRLTINATTFTGAPTSVVFPMPSAETGNAVRTTLRVCGRT